MSAVVAYVMTGYAPPAVAQVDQQRAQEYFKEALALCERDGGRLWGVPICAPMVIFAMRTQRLDAQGAHHRDLATLLMRALAVQQPGKHPAVPETTLHGKASFEWIEGGAFLLMHSQLDDDRFLNGIASVGSHGAQGPFFMLYFDERGVSRKYDFAFV